MVYLVFFRFVFHKKNRCLSGDIPHNVVLQSFHNTQPVSMELEGQGGAQ